MGIFTEKKKVKLAPRAGESIAGGDWLNNFLKSWGQAGAEPEVPVAGTAELTPMQQLIQGDLGNVYAGANENTALAEQEYRDILGEKYNPYEGDYFKGFRELQESLGQQDITGIRQGANLGGMLKSTPRGALESKSRQQTSSNIKTELGRLLLEEQARRERAAGGLQTASANKIATAANISAIAEQKRLIEQQKQDNIYNAALQSFLLPYQTQANIALAMMGYSPGTITTGGGLTDLGFAAQTGASMFSFGGKK